MLRFMRKYARGWFVKIIFGAIIVVFVAFFGYGTLRPGDEVVGRVGSHKITLMEYRENYDRLLKLYRNLYRDKLDDAVLKQLKLKEQAMNQIIDKYLVLAKAKEMGLSVTDKEFAEHIARIEAFKRNGKFDEKAYIEVLNKNGLDPKRFEESERASMLSKKLFDIVKDNGVFVNDGDAWQAYVKEKGKVDLAYAQFDPGQFKKAVSVSDQELASIYEKEKDSHKGETTYRLKYIVIDDKGNLKDDVAYTDLLKAKDIEAYGKQKGLDVLDLGLLPESEVLKRLKDLKGEQWLKELKKGDISLPVRGMSKSYIFQVVDREEGKPIDKSIVLKEIRERVTSEKAKAMAKAEAEDAIATKKVQFKQETGYFPRGLTDIPKVGRLPAEHMAVLSLSEQNREYAKPVEINGSYYVFAYKGEDLPDKKLWEQQKEAYKKFLLTRSQDEAWKALLEDLRKKEKVQVDWKEIG